MQIQSTVKFKTPEQTICRLFQQTVRQCKRRTLHRLRKFYCLFSFLGRRKGYWHESFQTVSYSNTSVSRVRGWGKSGHAPGPIRSVNGTWSPAVKDFYHTKMAHILLSVYSVFFQPYSTSEPITINNIHIIDRRYICIITSSDSSLAPSLSMTYLLHVITPFPLNCLNETKRLKVEHQNQNQNQNVNV